MSQNRFWSGHIVSNTFDVGSVDSHSLLCLAQASRRVVSITLDVGWVDSRDHWLDLLDCWYKHAATTETQQQHAGTSKSFKEMHQFNTQQQQHIGLSCITMRPPWLDSCGSGV
ncbi:hypothetical protein L1987_13324 [Smallanthus sonchifolius]|uniref:Uncharacterized protein n=1 Tax=Smallanthus sonchifolius TaxID=185202 RepID=A0ACB9JIW6_9ASTR|nr:hypothetical protein L1987_13324 [Smallanthus sonchifolius]